MEIGPPLAGNRELPPVLLEEGGVCYLPGAAARAGRQLLVLLLLLLLLRLRLLLRLVLMLQLWLLPRGLRLQALMRRELRENEAANDLCYSMLPYAMLCHNMLCYAIYSSIRITRGMRCEHKWLANYARKLQ